MQMVFDLHTGCFSPLQENMTSGCVFILKKTQIFQRRLSFTLSPVSMGNNEKSEKKGEYA